MLVTTAPAGTPLDELEVNVITEGAAWCVLQNVQRLHAAGISHGAHDAYHVIVDDGVVALTTSALLMRTPTKNSWIDRDSVGLLVATALLVGNDRAVDAAVGVLGKDRVAQLIPFVQPPALPDGATSTVRSTRPRR